VVVAVIAVRMVKVIADEIVDVIFVLHDAMTAAGTVDMRSFVRSAGVT